MTTEEDDDMDLGDMRLLFDFNEPTQIRDFSFPGVTMQAVCAEQQQPGALQSGIYLWPAAEALCVYLCEHWSSETENVVEFGAGCGIVGLACYHLLKNKQGVVAFTDRDWACLKLVEKSIKLLPFQDEEEEDDGKESSKTKATCFPITWTTKEDESVPEEMKMAVWDLAVGSDLVYSTESAKALFCMVSKFMPSSSEKPWKFLLASSFRDPETTQIIEDQCTLSKLKRKVLEESYHNNCLIEEYSRM